jgi:N-acetylglucosamine-6-phosphate deacetylase
MKISLITTFLITLLIQTTSNKINFTDSINGIYYKDGKPVSLELINGNISDISRPNELIKNSSWYLAPGLIDIQINGYMGVDFSGPDLTVEEIKKATKALWKVGVTSYFPTIITSDFSRMKKNFTILSKAKEDPEIGSSLAGFHLEGPYISPVDGFRGAHLEKYTRKPNWQEFLILQKAAKNNIRLITVAPELDGAIQFIKKLVDSGVIVSLGHHNGSVSQIKDAVSAGARMATHLGNGCANMINRHNNPIWPQLSNDLITPTLIADGFHLNREEIRTFYKTKGADNTILVSDALDLAGLPPGEYIRGERKLLLTPNVVKFPDINALAGAASPISKCLEVVMDFTNCSLEDAIKMASLNPAKMFSLNDRGLIKKGKRGDIVLFTMKGDKIQIKKTFVAGKEMYSSDNSLTKD